MKQNNSTLNLSVLMKATAMACLLAGCTSNMDDIKKKMADIDAQPALNPPSSPLYMPAQDYIYSAQRLRSPFMPPSLDLDIHNMSGKAVRPDPNRPKQLLEQFPVEQLVMRGTIKAQRGPMFALIQPPEGEIMRVPVGAYLGVNDGRIVSITPSEIHLVEIVPDGADGFVERPRTLVLPNSQK